MRNLLIGFALGLVSSSLGLFFCINEKTPYEQRMVKKTKIVLGWDPNLNKPDRGILNETYWDAQGIFVLVPTEEEYNKRVNYLFHNANTLGTKERGK